jgi:hypothetical protein
MTILAIKETADLAPWADAVYGCDAPWWIYRKGLPEFKGLKLAYHKDALERFPDLHRVEIPDIYTAKLKFEKTGSVGAGGEGHPGGGGGHSGFQAINLALQFGAKRVLLVGFDLNETEQVNGGFHYYGRNNWTRANNPTAEKLSRWAKTIDGLRGQIAGLGVEILNASQSSRIKAFRKVTIEQALQAWT